MKKPLLNKISYLVTGALLSATAILGGAELIASPGVQGFMKQFMAGDVVLKKTGDIKLEIHADTDSPTANSVLLDVKTGNASPTSKFTVDEDGDLYAAGNVGIGSASPGSTLDVNGTGQFDGLLSDGDLDLNGNDIIDVQSITTPAQSTLPTITLDSNSAGADTWADQGAWIAIGESAPSGSASMHMTYVGNGYGYTGAGTVSSGIPAGGYWRYLYNSQQIYTPANVGIGSTSPGNLLSVTGSGDFSTSLRVGSAGVPSDPLDVDGAANLSTTLTVGSTVSVNTATTTGVINATGGDDLPGLWLSGEDNIWFDSGQVRITTHDTYGNWQIKTGADNDDLYCGAGTGAIKFRMDEAGLLHVYTAPSGTIGNAISWNLGLAQTNGGNVAIGATSASAKLDVVGSAEINGQLDMQGNKIVDLATPTATTDAATKAYVDSLIGGSSANKIQTFTSSGTWTRPTGVDVVYVIAVGGGGGGGGGGSGSRYYASRTGGSGGGGGAGGQIAQRWVAVSGNITVTIGGAGSGGTGGAGATSTSYGNSGTAGTDGGDTTFGSLLTAPGGEGGGQGIGGGSSGSAKAGGDGGGPGGAAVQGVWGNSGGQGGNGGDSAYDSTYPLAGEDGSWVPPGDPSTGGNYSGSSVTGAGGGGGGGLSTSINGGIAGNGGAADTYTGAGSGTSATGYGNGGGGGGATRWRSGTSGDSGAGGNGGNGSPGIMYVIWME